MPEYRHMRSSPACINPSILQQFAREDLSEDETQTVDQHIRQCPRCAALLERQFSTLIQILQASAGKAQHAEQERIEQLILRLEELPAHFAGQEEAVEGQAPESPQPPAVDEPPTAGISLR